MTPDVRWALMSCGAAARVCRGTTNLHASRAVYGFSRTLRRAAIVLSLVASAGRASAQTPLLIDPDITVGSGATIATSAGAAVAAAEDRIVPARLFEEHGLMRRTANITYRYFRFALFDLPQEQWLLVANHEIFGHGGRLRERFSGPISYSIDAPPPYGPGGGATFFAFDREPSVHELLAISAGGMEANAVAADLVATQALAAGRLGAREAMRYFGMRLDSTFYILGTSDAPEEPGHDVSDFILTYNDLASAAGTPTITPGTLRKEALVSLADPMLAYALFGIGRFIATGRQDTSLPMIHIGGVRYLPSFRYRLTAFGTEWSLVNDLALGERRARIEVRSGRSTDASPWGIGIDAPVVATWRDWRFDVGADLWKQPPLTLDASAPIDLRLEWGGELRSRAARAIGRIGGAPMNLLVDAGVKSRGFKAGEPLDGGPVIRVGLGFPMAPR